MKEEILPKEFKGYSTADLVKIWEDLKRGINLEGKAPMEMISVMRELMEKYNLCPGGWSWEDQQERKDIVRAKKLLAPYGVDPAPWADAEGNELENWVPNPEDYAPGYYLDLEEEDEEDQKG